MFWVSTATLRPGRKTAQRQVWGPLTAGGDERQVEVPGEERLGQVSEELLQQGAHVVRVVLLRQLHLLARVKFLPQLYRVKTQSITVSLLTVSCSISYAG